MPETEVLVINTGPMLALIAGYGDLSLLEYVYKRVLVPFEVCQEIDKRIARLNGLKLTGSIGVLIRAKKCGLDFSMSEIINRMQSQGIYLSQRVIDFALRQYPQGLFV